ncbi:MAG: amino acid ABC transporter substrate-binding protein [Cyanobacteria bacterium P01_A01_bin.40]
MSKIFSKNNLEASNPLEWSNFRSKLIIILAGLLLTTSNGCGADLLNKSKVTSSQKPAIRQGNRLDTIKNRGRLICGINDRLLGFSYKEPDGSYSGISVDLCRAIAVALFDDPKAVEFRHLSSESRFTAVASGEVDILSRNTTWNLSRDSGLGLDFPPTNFYDGQGLMVNKDSKISSLEDLQGKSICVPINTTTEANLAEQMRKHNIAYQPVLFENADDLYQTYVDRGCDAATSDRSELVARRSQITNPEAHQVLDTVLSKEPIGSVIANGEPAWFDVVTWVTYAVIKAEELQINSGNIESLTDSKNPQIKRFLGIEGNLGANLDLSADFARRIVQQIGNYSEIYERNIGQPFNLERGANALWKDGGLMYAPPFR